MYLFLDCTGSILFHYEGLVVREHFSCVPHQPSSRSIGLDLIKFVVLIIAIITQYWVTYVILSLFDNLRESWSREWSLHKYLIQESGV